MWILGWLVSSVSAGLDAPLISPGLPFSLFTSIVQFSSTADVFKLWSFRRRLNRQKAKRPNRATPTAAPTAVPALDLVLRLDGYEFGVGWPGEVELWFNAVFVETVVETVVDAEGLSKT